MAVKISVNILSNWNDVEDFNRIFWCGYSKLAGQSPYPSTSPRNFYHLDPIQSGLMKEPGLGDQMFRSPDKLGSNKDGLAGVRSTRNSNLIACFSAVPQSECGSPGRKMPSLGTSFSMAPTPCC